MTKPKKQHYVPQFHLRNFATGKKKKARLWVLDKLNASVFQASVRDVGHENKFYEYSDELGSICLEGLMEKLDSKASNIIKGILEKSSLPLVAEDSIWLSYYVAAQMIRTPTVRKDMDNFRAMILEKWGSEIVYDGDSKPVAEYTSEDSKLSSLGLIKRSVPELAKLLQEKVWILCQSAASSPYVIADNPVAKHNMVERKHRGNLGLKNEGIEIYLPLSPQISIQLICPKLAAAALMSPDLTGRYADAMHKMKVLSLKPENVEFLNSLQVIWAERFVYSQKREQLDMPLDMLRTNPELRYGTGVRQSF